MIELYKYNGYLGYPFAKGIVGKREKSNLGKSIGYKGKLYTKASYCIQLVINGYRPIKLDTVVYDRNNNSKTVMKYYLLDSNSDGYTITKTEFKFSTYLVSNDIISEDGVDEIIFQENIETENRKREEQERQKEEDRERKLKEKSESDAKKWLVDSIYSYKELDKLEIVRNISLDMLGEYDLYQSRLLLFCIFNVENEICRQQLKDRLHLGNKMSRKVFYHMTGIRLPNTLSGTMSVLNDIDTDCYTCIIPYKLTIPDGKILACKLSRQAGWHTVVFAEEKRIGNLDIRLSNICDSWYAISPYCCATLGFGTTKEDCIEDVKARVGAGGTEHLKELEKNTLNNFLLQESQVEKKLGYEIVYI